MKKRLLFLLSCLILVSNLFGQDRENLKKQIDKIIHYDTKIDFKETPGLVIAVKFQDSIFFISYGTMGKDVETEVNENTIFEIGSLTKAFTASLTSVLVSEGKMEFEKPVNSYFPKEEKNIDLENITIDQLLTHTSRLPKMPLEFGVKELETNNPYAHYTNQDLMEFYKNFILIESKRKKRKRRKKKKGNYLYSNVNYALLENAIEKSQNQSYEKILAEKIINPMGLKNTQVQLSEDQKEQLATGYNMGGKLAKPWTYQSFKGAVGLKSTAKDLITFAEAHMGNGNANLGNALEQTHLPLEKTDLNKRVKSGRGWHIISTDKKFYDIVGHTGNTNGHRSYMAFIKETQTAVVILSNSEHSLHNLGYRILYMINNNWKKW